MSTSSVTVGAAAFKPVEIKVTVTSEVDFTALKQTLRQGVISLPEVNPFVDDLTKKLQCI